MNNKLTEIINADLTNISADILEISLDKFIDNEIVRSFPFLGTVFNILKLGTSINDKIFTNKLLHFLNEIKYLDPEVIIKEIRYIDDSAKYNHKVGEKILEIISRIDSDEKPRIVGKLFRNYLNKNLSYNEFLKYCHIVEKAFYYDLLNLENFDENGSLFKEQSIELYGLGLCEMKDIGSFDSLSEADREYEAKVKSIITESGIKIVNFGLKNV